VAGQHLLYHAYPSQPCPIAGNTLQHGTTAPVGREAQCLSDWEQHPGEEFARRITFTRGQALQFSLRENTK